MVRLRMIRLSRFILLLLLPPVISFASDAEVKGLLKSLTTIDSYGASSIMGGLVGDESSMLEEKVVGRIMVKSEVAEDIKLNIHYENSFSKGGEYLSAVDALKGGRTSNFNIIDRKPPKDSASSFHSLRNMWTKTARRLITDSTDSIWNIPMPITVSA